VEVFCRFEVFFDIALLEKLILGTIKIYQQKICKEIIILLRESDNRHFRKIPVEKHDTAAWANIRTTKRVSKVTVPDEFQVENARDYVEENQK